MNNIFLLDDRGGYTIRCHLEVLNPFKMYGSDHGYVEPVDHPSRRVLVTRVVLNDWYQIIHCPNCESSMCQCD
jgi:hypothetical protein